MKEVAEWDSEGAAIASMLTITFARAISAIPLREHSQAAGLIA
jgi:hypothetical protein